MHLTVSLDVVIYSLIYFSLDLLTSPVLKPVPEKKDLLHCCICVFNMMLPIFHPSCIFHYLNTLKLQELAQYVFGLKMCDIEELDYVCFDTNLLQQ